MPGSPNGASSSGCRRSSPTKLASSDGVEAREREFWDEHVPSLSDCLDEYRRPDPNTALLLDALEPLRGKTVLDFACGTGVLSAQLAERGAAVTGIDLSPRSIERAREVAEHAGVSVELVLGGVAELGERTFDAIAGKYALHHVDVEAVTPLLAKSLRPGGRAAFLETMATNRLLGFLRHHVAGRYGVPRHGTADEHPLGDEDVAVIARAFGGPVERRVGELVFLRLFDRQILAYRSRRASRLLGGADDLLLRIGADRLSYHQVIVADKPA